MEKKTFYEWVHDIDTPDWIAAVVIVTIFLSAVFYSAVTFALFSVGQEFGGALMIVVPLVAAWWRIIASYLKYRGDK